MGLSLTAVAIDPRTFSTPEIEARYQRFVDETRCLVCQNQNLAGSNAPLAEDLRTTIAEMLEAGRSDQDIRDFLTARYGDFVLYRPPLKPTTIALWFGPALIVVIGALALALSLRRRMRMSADALAGDDADVIRRRLEELQRDEL